MAEISNKKRKRQGEAGVKPKKKVAMDAPPPAVTVSSVLRPKFCPPVIASSPGFDVPKNTLFRSYLPKDEPLVKAKQPKHAIHKELLLHSTDHRSMDYTAKEEGIRGSTPLVNHYVGVYDPKTGKMQVVEAKKMILRGAVRAKQASTAAMGERDAKESMAALRVDLGQTFGTRKARKAIEDKVLNAISPSKRPGDNSPAKIDAASRAMLTSVGEVTSKMATREELDAVVNNAKPVPKANLDAEDISDAYDPYEIIGEETLNLVPIREWQEKARHKEGIQSPSRFVIHRVNALAANDDEELRLRVLRYLSFVLVFYLSTKPGRDRGTRQIPAREALREALAPAPEGVVENIRRKFSEDGQMRKFHIDLLMTHCCVFASIVDNFEVDTQNLRDDLRLDQKSVNQYFQEIGGRVRPVAVKGEGRATNVARLTLPLQFPRQRHIAPKR